MLLEFKTSNYKSFKHEMTFSMVPTTQKDLQYSVLEEKVGGKTYKGLCSAVIYGPNAAGKTNIIGAMDTFKNIVLRGNIRDARDQTANFAANNLMLIPFCKSEEAVSVSFAIKFIYSGVLYEYSLVVDIGKFGEDSNYPRRILQEILYVNETQIFCRDSNIKLGNLKKIKNFLNSDDTVNSDDISKIAKDGLVDDELFLKNGFKSIISKSLVAQIGDWFEKCFITVYSADKVRAMPTFVNDMKEGQLRVLTDIDKAAHIFGSQSETVGLIKGDNGSAAWVSIVDKNINKAFPVEVFESLGTVRFINELPLLLDAFANGGTVVFDEFDASIHPMALMNIVNIFHNDELNKNHAQLIFNTQNPIFLRNGLYRRDEIKFVEIDDQTHESTHYSLSDFKTNETSGTRQNSDYMTNYFVNRYGAIKDIDFEPIFQRVIANVPPIAEKTEDLRDEKIK